MLFRSRYSKLQDDPSAMRLRPNGDETQTLLGIAERGTDHVNRSSIDRKDGATGGAREGLKMIVAYGHGARHAVECAECGRAGSDGVT